MGSFRSDGKFIYLEDSHMEFYVPVDYFDESKHFAKDYSSYIEVLGVFDVGLFKDGKVYDYKVLNHPYMIKAYVYDSEIKTVNIPKAGEVKCKVISFEKGQKIMDASIVQDSVNGLMFLNLIIGGKIPKLCPYNKAYSLWIKNKEMHGVNFGVRPEVEEMILALVYREKGKLTSKFSKYYGLDEKANPYNFELADLRKVCQYASTFSAVTFEDFDTMVTTSINRSRNHTPESYSPIEDTIKM